MTRDGEFALDFIDWTCEQVCNAAEARRSDYVLVERGSAWEVSQIGDPEDELFQ
jgi:hypothetical protein